MSTIQPLAGKVAIITGASRNQGQAYAETLAADGASVVVHYHNPARQAEAEAVAARIHEAGGTALVVQADLTQVKEVEKLFNATMQRFDHLDILINNSGMVIKKPVEQISEEEFDAIFAINTKAAFFCLREAARVMADHGRIVNIVTTILGLTTGNYSIYAGSKAPLEDFTRALAKEIGPRGITVNCVAPGPINDSFYYPVESPESIAAVKRQSINGELGEVADIVPLVRFLVTPEARWITAQTIFINGGLITR